MKRGSKCYQTTNNENFYALIYAGTTVLMLDKKEEKVRIDTSGYITRSTTDAINIALEDINVFNIRAAHRPSLGQIILMKNDRERPLTFFSEEYQELTIPLDLLTKKDK